jgi:hypothetical protein
VEPETIYFLMVESKNIMLGTKSWDSLCYLPDAQSADDLLSKVNDFHVAYWKTYQAKVRDLSGRTPSRDTSEPMAFLVALSRELGTSPRQIQGPAFITGFQVIPVPLAHKA